MPKRGVSIRPEAVRIARTEAGLTLSQLAGPELTKQALSLVERGRVRPSLQTLHLISARTGKPIEYFLAGPLAPEPITPELEQDLAELERLVAVEDYETVVELGERLLAGVVESMSRARIQLSLGEALLKLFKPERALEYLGSARAAFHAAGDGWRVVEAMNSEANALYLQEDPGAMELAREALAMCRKLDPVPTWVELRLIGNLANMHTARHEWSLAIGMCEQAIALADAVHDLGRMARLHYTLAISYRNLGDTGRAMAHVQKAMGLHEFERDGAQRARLQNTLGLLLLQQGDLDGAESSLRRSLESYQTTGRESGKSHVLMSMAELHLARGENAEAEALLRDAVARFEAAGERMSVALGWQLLGRTQARLGRQPDSDAAFATALQVLEELDVAERLVECHAAYAEVLDERGDVQGAKRHWRLAAVTGRPDLAAGGPAQRAAESG